MKSDSDIKRDVESRWKWSPDLDETDVAAKVNGGIVTLTGFARSDPKSGVRRKPPKGGRRCRLANDIEVRTGLRGADGRSGDCAELDLARSQARTAHEWRECEGSGSGWTYRVEGNNFQRELVESALWHLPGVLSVDDQIKVKPRAEPAR